MSVAKMPDSAAWRRCLISSPKRVKAPRIAPAMRPAPWAFVPTPIAFPAAAASPLSVASSQSEAAPIHANLPRA
jgi:hypothetical protein